MISVQYCTYAFYTDTYGGTAITSEKAFTRYELLARAVIDRLTYGRLKHITNAADIPEEVMFAVCVAGDYACNADAYGGHTVASETVSKHSVSYGDTDSSVEAGMARCAMQFLATSSCSWMLYKGVYPFERHRHHHPL
ncbi:MAG: hypothetical protein LUH03_09940 [Oscillospiraceae bacterium]|nr:hypothetical protein [Oscillospiraceae bacterium]